MHRITVSDCVQFEKIYYFPQSPLLRLPICIDYKNVHGNCLICAEENSIVWILGCDKTRKSGRRSLGGDHLQRDPKNEMEIRWGVISIYEISPAYAGERFLLVSDEINLSD